MLDDEIGDEELMTVQGLDGYGELYQAPDGAMYQMQGGLGAGIAGEVRQGSDGRLYQWVEGYDGLGGPVGFWNLIPMIAKAVLPMASKILPQLFSAGGGAGGGGAGQILQRILPQASQFLQQVAAPRPPASRQAPDSDELTGIGALYQAPDGGLYQVQGVAEDERFAEDEWIRGLDEDERLAEDDLIRGLDEDERYGADEALLDAEGYVREDGVRGVDAFVASEPPQARPFVRPAQAPDMWRPLW